MLTSRLTRRLLASKSGLVIFLGILVVIGLFARTLTSWAAPFLKIHQVVIISSYLVACIWYLLLKKFYRRDYGFLDRPQMKMSGWIVIAHLGVIFLGPNLVSTDIPFHRVRWFLTLLLFAFGIGVSEELLFRGVIFAALQRFGMWTAVNISSIAFGLIHLTNWGKGHSNSYTSLQVISAACAGYFLCGLMMFSRSIWVPVVFHALIDLPLMTIKSLGVASISMDARTMASFTLTHLVLVGIGVALIKYRSFVGADYFVQRVNVMR